MKNLVHDIMQQMVEGKIDTTPKGTKKPLTAKAAKMKDPVLIKGYGVMEREQAKRLFPDSDYTETKLYKEEVLEEGAAQANPMKTFGTMGQSAQSMAPQMQRGPTQQEMIKAQKHMEKEHNPGHKMIGLSVGLDGKAQVKSAITQTSVVGEPVKKPNAPIKKPEMNTEETVNEAKWTTPYKQPAKDLKKGESLYIKHPDNNYQMITGRYQRTEHNPSGKAKPGHPHGHLIMLNKELPGRATKLYWAPHDEVYRNIEDGWPMAKPVKEDVLDEMNNSGLHPGWMLKKDPALAKKVKDATAGIKDLKKYAGRYIDHPTKVSVKVRVDESITDKKVHKVMTHSEYKKWSSYPDTPKHDVYHNVDGNGNVGVKLKVNTSMVNKGSGMTEAVETKIQMTMPLFIRIMEWAREEAKDDVALHQLAEKLAAVNGVADMDNYESLLESPQAWARVANHVANELPNEVINAALAAFGTGDHEENKSSIKRSQKLQNVLKRSIRLMSRKKLS